MPRWDLEKFNGAEEKIGSAMKKVACPEGKEKSIGVKSGRTTENTSKGLGVWNKIFNAKAKNQAKKPEKNTKSISLFFCTKTAKGFSAFITSWWKSKKSPASPTTTNGK